MGLAERLWFGQWRQAIVSLVGAGSAVRALLPCVEALTSPHRVALSAEATAGAGRPSAREPAEVRDGKGHAIDPVPEPLPGDIPANAMRDGAISRRPVLSYFALTFLIS